MSYTLFLLNSTHNDFIDFCNMNVQTNILLNSKSTAWLLCHIDFHHITEGNIIGLRLGYQYQNDEEFYIFLHILYTTKPTHNKSCIRPQCWYLEVKFNNLQNCKILYDNNKIKIK